MFTVFFHHFEEKFLFENFIYTLMYIFLVFDQEKKERKKCYKNK